MTSPIGKAPVRRGALALIALAVLAASVPSVAPASPAPTAYPAVPGEIIVRFKPGTPASQRSNVRERAGVSTTRNLLLADTQLVHNLSGVPTSAALTRLNAEPSVRYAEPNWLDRLQRTPNDPRFGEQWSLHNTGQTIQGIAGTAGADISAPAAWDTTTEGPSVKVAVLDSGIDYFHPDLAQNMWHNPGEAVADEARNGSDDEGNGHIDDLHGWDFLDDDAAPVDMDSHGTPVAGIVGAVGDNGLGIAGVNWKGALVALRVCDTTCPNSAIIDAIVYADRIGADVANMSLGGPTNSQARRDAMAAAANTLFVVSPDRA